ncbi:TPA_asm: RNA-directed RNA polymerase [ssRNA phage Gerhypos.4_51]|uniref:RNA-directed RNA polymerase n=2 Tax=Leviviricetes TaxID=2842243 RepID=A0A8S5KYJ7_9VIRU|nr:RNA-directed RNA polymerase [ssRNA phage Gerhypos.4_51]QDH91200.1 MAG: RNA-dependent RNA polymerase [Leviviridae sp.]DAD50207.1 TPA_asm: RNA-directed RNA polymerase [ssRNA phage Gerhypos.4_51]
MRPSQTILVLEDLQKCFVGPVYRNRVELDSSDRATVTDVYQQWLLLMVDSGYLHHGTLLRDARRLLSDMMEADVLVLNNAFADLLHLVRCKTIKGFKALCSKISSHLFSFIKQDVAKIEVGDIYAAKRLVQLFSYTSRLTLHNIDLTEQCLIDYMATEDGMSSYRPKSLLSSLNKIIKRWMLSFDPDRIHFQHGPGGVAGHGRIALEVKYKDLTYDRALTSAFGHPWWSNQPIRSTLDRISHTIFVPKSYKTFRTISMESSTLQYCQQGILREIDRVVESSPYLRNHIGFHEQERNQSLARTGSIERNYATIDLSAASDSVSYQLVKDVFRGTKLLKYLCATRSRRTLLPDGRLIRLKKFAPMGSALCFPVETIIFAAVCQYVAREHGVTGDYSVFGDDIIVPTQCAQDVMLVLEILGFRVNREKSFFDPNCWFRESCGGEYCDGFDVTPMRVSRKYNHLQRDVHLTGLIDLSNEAFKRGFSNLRTFFLKKLRENHFRALFSPTSVNSVNYTNYHLKHRWNSDLHRIECRATSLAPDNGWTSFENTFERRDVEGMVWYQTLNFPRPPEDSDEEIRYRHWLASTHNRYSIGDGFVSETSRVIVSTKNRWRSKPFELSDQQFIDLNLTRE